jgi:predicted amidohydrolase
MEQDMSTITVQVPDKLAQRLRPMSPWLATVLEISLAGFETSAARITSEIIAFLSTGPSPVQVSAYTISEASQERLRRLLALNEAGLLSTEEQNELDEIEQIEHIMVMLKAQAREESMRDSR